MKVIVIVIRFINIFSKTFCLKKCRKGESFRDKVLRKCLVRSFGWRDCVIFRRNLRRFINIF